MAWSSSIRVAYPQARLVSTSPPTTVVIPLDRPVFLIGSGEVAHLRLKSRQIDRAHAVVLNADGRLLLRDLISEHGLSVNRAAVASAVLNDGDEVTFGKYSFRVELGVADPLSTSAVAPAASLIDGNRTLALRGPLCLIGSDARCDAPLNAELVAPKHALACAADGKWVMRGLEPSNFPRRSGRAKRRWVLQSNERVGLGAAELRCVIASEAPAISRIESHEPAPIEYSATTALTTDPAPAITDTEDHGEPVPMERGATTALTMERAPAINELESPEKPEWSGVGEARLRTGDAVTSADSETRQTEAPTRPPLLGKSPTASVSVVPPPVNVEEMEPPAARPLLSTAPPPAPGADEQPPARVEQPAQPEPEAGNWDVSASSTAAATAAPIAANAEITISPAPVVTPQPTAGVAETAASVAAATPEPVAGTAKVPAPSAPAATTVQPIIADLDADEDDVADDSASSKAGIDFEAIRQWGPLAMAVAGAPSRAPAAAEAGEAAQVSGEGMAMSWRVIAVGVVVVLVVALALWYWLVHRP